MESNQTIRMWTPNTVILFLLTVIGLLLAIYTISVGHGAVLDTNDIYPWGLLLGFIVLGGIAMAGGGFVIACAVYLFNWKKYKPIARPAILTAFLGYLMAIIGLFIDIAHPFRLWHPAIMWQVHSVMWIVAIHVILYTTTLAIEFSPMLFERLGWVNATNTVNRIMIGAVVFGVMLSTLHQASLGAVFVLVPSKMSPLWYTEFLPYLFLTSAIAMGLCMVSTETILSGKAFNHKVDKEILTGLAKGTLVTLIIYLIFKLFFQIKNAGISAAFTGSIEANMYLLEMVLGIILPIILLLSKNNRTNKRSILGINILVIAGILVNRMNVCVFSMEQYTRYKGAAYFPSISEFFITLGIVSFGIFLFKLAAKHLPLFVESQAH